MLDELKPFSAARIASAVVYKGKIISVGFNRRKSHPIQKKYGRNEESIFLHAEIDALVQATKILTRDEIKSSIIYVARRKHKENQNKEVWGLAKPCEGCLKGIKDFGIQKIIYTMEDNKIGEMT